MTDAGDRPRTSEAASAIPGPWAAGWAALRRFYRPFILIQMAALALLVAYHLRPDVRAVCARLAAVKTAGGVGFAALSAAVAGGMLPELARALGDRRRYTMRGRGPEMVFNVAFFAFNGVVIEGLYRGEAALFGADARATTVIAKVVFDQFVFTPSWLPVIIALYMWQGRGFSLTATVAGLRQPRFYRTRVMPLLLPDWCFWIPMVAIIYALPVPLQFLLFVLALAAWSLIMVSVARSNVDDASTAALAP